MRGAGFRRISGFVPRAGGAVFPALPAVAAADALTPRFAPTYLRRA
jgi:hypothetical protein